MSPYWYVLTKVTITRTSFRTRMLTIVYTCWKWQNILSGNHHKKVFCSLQGEDSHHSSAAVGGLDCCPGTLKCLLSATAEAQGSNMTAAQCHSQEKVPCLEETRVLGVSKNSAIARKKQEEKPKVLRAGRTSQWAHSHSQDQKESTQLQVSKSHSGGQSVVYWSITNKFGHTLISTLTLIFPSPLITSQPLEKGRSSFIFNIDQCNPTDGIIFFSTKEKMLNWCWINNCYQVPRGMMPRASLWCSQQLAKLKWERTKVHWDWLL